MAEVGVPVGGVKQVTSEQGGHRNRRDRETRRRPAEPWSPPSPHDRHPDSGPGDDTYTHGQAALPEPSEVLRQQLTHGLHERGEAHSALEGQDDPEASERPRVPNAPSVHRPPPTPRAATVYRQAGTAVLFGAAPHTLDRVA